MTSLERLPASFIGTIILPIKIFLFIGLDFFDDAETRFKNNLKLTTFLIGYFTFLFGQILYFLNIDDIGDANFLQVANAIPCSMMLLQSLFKFKLIRHKHMIRRIILDIAELWPTEFHNAEREEVMNEWIRRMKAFCDIVLRITAFGMVVYIYSNIFVYFFLLYSDGSTPYMFTFQLYYYVKIDAMWKYLVFYITQAVTGTIIHICMYWPCDLLLLTLTVDICILLRLLQYDLKNIRVEEGSEECLANLKRMVQTHQKLLRLADKLNETFGVIMFTVVVFSSIILCFFGFLTLALTPGFQLLRNVLTVLQILFIVFYLMLPGQILSDTSSGVADAAYHSLWYNTDSKFRKIIFIIIARSQKPSKLRALSYSDMNFNAFCKICSTSWSYLSLVNQMYQKGESDNSEN